MNVVSNYPQINMRLSPELKEWVHSQAKEDGRTVNSWLTRLIEKAKKETATSSQLSTEPRT